MEDFDFIQFVNKFKLPRWFVLKTGKTKSQFFAAEFTLGLYLKTGRRVVRRTNTFRRLWSRRLKELLSRQLWRLSSSPEVDPSSPLFELKRFALSYRRALCCRPTYLYYVKSSGQSINYQVRPCWRTRICPFCIARISAAQYRLVKHTVNIWAKKNVSCDSFMVVCRVLREFVPAIGFNAALGCDQEKIAELARPLKFALRQHKAHYDALVRSKRVARHTIGSMWRVTVDPQIDGWFVETRQFLLCRANLKKLPVVTLPNAAVVYNERLPLVAAPKGEEFDDAFYPVFGEFCRYHKSLLIAPPELVAAYLHASAGIKLFRGSGLFLKTCRGLLRTMRKPSVEKKDAPNKIECDAPGACVAPESQVAPDADEPGRH